MHLLIAPLVAALIVVSPIALPTRAAATKPRVTMVKADEAPVAFLVEATNETTRELLVRADGLCTAKIDGAVVARDGVGSSGGGRRVQPGETWKEIVRLVVAPDPSGRRPRNPDARKITGNVELPVRLSSGSHTASFSCASDDWSNDVSFVWPAAR